MITWSEIVIRLSLAALLGALVGIERERKDWAAGLRTHMMVCVGSALTMLVSAFGFRDILGTSAVVLDPSRIAAQVISGIGFIGAGTILFLRQEVIRGLTTAAGLWTVAAIGLATGGGMYFAAAVATGVVLIILLGAETHRTTPFLQIPRPPDPYRGVARRGAEHRCRHRWIAEERTAGVL
jgi:putative Mg2+ transporter-C (MgtC) family protein